MKKKMFLGANNIIFENAKVLRRNPTHSELLMWSYLRQKPFGYKFRRQHPIGIYIADFYCHALRLIIEIDGSIHDVIDVQEHDKERQNNLEKDGLTFIRFTNQEVEKKFEKVISEIEEYLTSRNSE